MAADEHLFPVPAQRVLEVVAEAYGLAVEQLAGLNRDQPTPTARRIAYRLLHEESGLSWLNVTKRMGRQPGTKGYVAYQGRQADPEALAVLRSRLRPNGQEALW